MTRLRRNLSQHVATAVKAMGKATVDDLQPLFPEYTRAQLMKALSNAKAAGWVYLARHGTGGRGGRGVPGLWAPGENTPTNIEPTNCIRPPNSAWELAHSRQHPGTWPIPGTGVKYRLLGDLQEEGRGEC